MLKTLEILQNLTQLTDDSAAMKPPAGLFLISTYRTGEPIKLAETSHTNSLSVLAKGNIKVKIPYGIGESTICILMPGDLTDLTGIEAGTGFDAKLYADGDTEVFSMGQKTFDNLVASEPLIMCHLIHSMMHNMQSIVRRVNGEIATLKNYIYGISTG